jgi:threonine/homoserine/homoserine lactone efflux protein
LAVAISIFTGELCACDYSRSGSSLHFTRALTQGKRAGLTSVAGVAFGNFGNAVGASIGLAAVFAVSSVAFTLVKYMGAAYLIYLGISSNV